MTDKKDDSAKTEEPLTIRPWITPGPGQTISRGPNVNLMVDSGGWESIVMEFYDKDTNQYLRKGVKMEGNPFRFTTDFQMPVGNNAINYRFISKNETSVLYSSGWFNVQ